MPLYLITNHEEKYTEQLDIDDFIATCAGRAYGIDPERQSVVPSAEELLGMGTEDLARVILKARHATVSCHPDLHSQDHCVVHEWFKQVARRGFERCSSGTSTTMVADLEPDSSLGPHYVGRPASAVLADRWRVHADELTDLLQELISSSEAIDPQLQTRAEAALKARPETVTVFQWPAPEPGQS